MRDTSGFGAACSETRPSNCRSDARTPGTISCIPSTPWSWTMLKVEEYLAEMSRSDKQELETRLVQALEHHLKMTSQDIPAIARGKNKRGWQDSIDEQRRQLLRLVTQHGSLRRQLSNIDLEKAYRKAAKSLGVEYPLA